MDNEMQQHFLQLYQQEFPRQEQVHIVASTPISTGWESDLFTLQLDYEEGTKRKSEEIILKLYHGERGIQKARREFNGLKQLVHSLYPVPEVFFAALDESPFGRACVAMEKIQGYTIGDIYDTSSKEKQQKLITRFCQLYVDLHALNWQPFVSDPTQYQASNLIHSWLIKAHTLVTQLQPLVFDPIFNWLQKKSEEVACQHLSVIHGDFHMGNVIQRDDGATFVIDWTGIDISDYRFDLAWTLLLFNSIHSLELRNFMFEEYERLVSHKIENIEFFEVIACTRRLFDITSSLTSGAVALGMKPGAEVAMRQMIGHIRLVYAQLQEKTGCSLPEIEKLILTLS